MAALVLASCSFAACSDDAIEPEPTDDAGASSSGRGGSSGGSSSGESSSSGGSSSGESSSSGGSSSGESSSSGGSSSGESSSSGGSSSGESSSSGGSSSGGSSSGGVVQGPEPGSPCAAPAERYTRECGTCGLETAFCTPANVVSGYGACQERDPSVCGLPVDPGEPEPEWSGYDLAIDFEIGSTRSVALDTPTGARGRPRTSKATCPVEYPASVTSTPYAYVRLRNPSDQPLRVELILGRGNGLGTVDGLLAAYAAVPETDAALLQCLGAFGAANCPDPQGLSAQKLACLQGDAAVTVPAQGTRYVYAAMYNAPSSNQGPLATWNLPALQVKRVAVP